MAVVTSPQDMFLMLADEPTDISLTALQGLWSAEQYLRLTNQTNRLIEFSDGIIEVLPMPTRNHQAISRLLFLALLALMQTVGGAVFYAPLRMQIRPGKFREPDILLLLNAKDPRNQNAYWLGADLVVEIVSPDDVDRDTVVKRAEYAEAGIAEYWIVNPLEQAVTVLKLEGSSFNEHGVFGRGSRATSVLLLDFNVAVNDVLDAE